MRRADGGVYRKALGAYVESKKPKLKVVEPGPPHVWSQDYSKNRRVRM